MSSSSGSTLVALLSLRCRYEVAWTKHYSVDPDEVAHNELLIWFYTGFPFVFEMSI